MPDGTEDPPLYDIRITRRMWGGKLLVEFGGYTKLHELLQDATEIVERKGWLEEPPT